MTKETNDTEIIETDEETDEGGDTGSVNWEARFTKLKERQRSAKTAYENRIAELEGKVKEAPKVEKELKSEFGLLEKAYLKASGVNDPDKVELLKKWQKDTGKGIEELVDHPFIKAEFEKLDTAKANQLATANIRGDAKDAAKDDVNYWLDKDEVPQGKENKKLRQKVLNEKLKRATDGSAGGKFYND